MDDQRVETSQPGAVIVWAALVALLGLLAVAASTESIELWQTPAASEQQPASVPTLEDEPARSIVRDDPSSGVNVFGFLVVLLLALLALTLVKVNIRQAPVAKRFRHLFGWGQLDPAMEDPISEVHVRDVDEEVGRARTALFDGDARNGIVACWMQLERGGLDAGLPRWASETAEEYSLRVVSVTSVDPGPLSELAELYREARFSDHQLDETYRHRAAAALGRISEGLTMQEPTS